MKTCLYCKEEVNDEAIKCRYCQSMLVPSQPEPKDRRKITYILDTGLIRFAKFAVAILCVFTVIGLFLFGFSLENTAKRLSESQNSLKEAQFKLEETQSKMDGGLEQLRVASERIKNLQSETELIRQKAENAFQAISQRELKSRELLIAMQDVEGKTIIKTVESEEPPLTEVGKTKLWKHGSRLRIAFLGGNNDLHKKARETISEFMKYANLIFDFVANDQRAHIRISFDKNVGNYSYIGRDALNIPASQATMNLNPSWAGNETNFRSSMLGTFSHAIGLLNEHSNPNARIPWNNQAVYKYYSGSPYFWKRAQIEYTVLGKWPSGSFPFEKKYDRFSITHMAIPNELTIGNFEVSAPSELSEGDKEWIGQLYPKQR